MALLCVAAPLAWDPGAIHFSSFKRVILWVGALLVWLAGRKGRVQETPDAVDWAALGLLGWLVLSMLWSPNPGRGLVDASLAVMAFVLFQSARSFVSDRQFQVALAWFVAAAAVLLSIWALIEWLETGGEPRAGIGNANYLAGLLAAQMPFLALVLSGWARWRSLSPEERFLRLLTQISMLVLILGAVLVTHSRAALSALVLAWALWIIRGRGPLAERRWARAGLVFLVLVGIGIGVVFFGGEGLAGRLYLARISLRIGAHAPWIGQGLGSYVTAFPAAQADYLGAHPGDTWLWTNAWSAHFEPMQLWVESGLVGVGLAFLFLFALVKQAGRMRGKDAEDSGTTTVDEERQVSWRADFQAACLASLGAFAVTMLSEAQLHQPAQAGLAALSLGVLVARRRGLLPVSGQEIPSARGVWKGASGMMFWMLSGVFLLGSGVCATRQYVAERFWGTALKTHAPTQRVGAFGKADKWACDRGQIQFQEALALARAGRGADALPLLHRALAARPDAFGYMALGNLLVGLGRREEAVDAYEASIRLHPRLAAAYYNLGLTLESLGKAERARGILLRAHSLLPGRYPRPK